MGKTKIERPETAMILETPPLETSKVIAQGGIQTHSTGYPTSNVPAEFSGGLKMTLNYQSVKATLISIFSLSVIS
jgi:hypothetical protein